MELYSEIPVVETIKKRTSVRTYNEKSLLSGEIKEKLSRFSSLLKGPFGKSSRFEIIESDIARRDANVRLGTYGVIRGAETYVVAAVKKGEKDLEEFGYIFESFILYATSLGLGTCWLGGTFKKSEFSKAIGQKDDEILPCISPLGFPGGRRSLLESTMRFSVGSDKRKSWKELFFQRGFHKALTAAEAGKYVIPLEMVRLAPSASNKQPWRILQDESVYHFYLQHTKGYAKPLGYDIQRVDLGIAMSHFEHTARELGISGKWLHIPPQDVSVPSDTEYIISWREG
ncbi:nitroreductase family protein [Desulfosporosinus sp. PR]|uniref:nitroreductase family protein n=1 Tax=Candidatus Desulfosporosinus nitrosoreducens TaxID=3401928 RepID=UPI0027FBF45B|nr:nitroreductase family protein [Desulfosporosinus sp. PR]MDQ7095931.1 nitroreductase family protein [Desulfosporosinus sp. PR]